MKKLDGKIAVVTGGNSGIGLATARRFVAEGAEVVVVARRREELDKVLPSLGPRALAVQADIARLEELDRVFELVKASKGRVDVLFANAGIGDVQPLGSITEGSFDRVFGVNVKGTLFTVQKALPLMKAGGSIILNGSTAGSMATPAFSVYSATKAAIRNLARCWALDLKGTGIRVNVLSPGATATPGLLEGIANQAGGRDALLAGLIALTPLGRVAEPEEIAAAALFLASDDSSYMTGSELFVDGGAAQV